MGDIILKKNSSSGPGWGTVPSYMDRPLSLLILYIPVVKTQVYVSIKFHIVASIVVPSMWY